MKTKNIYITICFFMITLFLSVASFAQPGTAPIKERKAERIQEKKENIESMKIGFITQKLNLTPEEAKVFWPVYNQYSDKLQDLRKKRRQDIREVKQNFDELSDKEVEQAVDNEIAFRQKELDIQKEYHSKFKSVLPIKKVAKLYAAEEQFKMVLLDKLKNKLPAKE